MSPAVVPPKSRKPRQRPGTAVNAKGRESVAVILDAAAALLAEEGAAGMSTRKIAARAGMHGGNVQYYFRSKQDLVRALLERYLGQSRERVERRMSSASPTREGTSATGRLRDGIDEILADQSSAPDCALFRELWALAAHDREIAAVVGEFYQRYIKEVAAMLRAVEPKLTAARATRAATMLVALLEGLSIVGPSMAATAASRRKAAAEICELAVGMVRGK